MAKTENTLSPLVYWAQNDNDIFLKIDLSDVLKPKVVLTEKLLEFEAEGLGAGGKNLYRFNLRFYERIEPKRSSWKVHDSRIEIQLRKIPNKFHPSGANSFNNFWPRLISQPQKPHWLKIDFNRWISSEPNDEENYDEKRAQTDFDRAKSKRSIMQDYPDVIKKLQKQEYGYIKEKAKKVYLVFYNLFQYLSFLYVAVIMGTLYFRDGNQEIRQIYITFNNVLKFVHILQYLEILHSLLRFTTDPVIYPFLHISLRNFIIYGIVEQDFKMQDKPIIYVLCFIWFMIELVRYSYNMTQLLKIEFKVLMAVRNKVWKPLYLMETILSGFIILQNHPYMRKIHDFPNKSSLILDMTFSMKIYVFLLISVGTYFTMRHIAKRRSRKSNSSPPRKHN